MFAKKNVANKSNASNFEIICAFQDKYYEYLSACRRKDSTVLHTSKGMKCGKGIQVGLARFRNAVNETGWEMLWREEKGIEISNRVHKEEEIEEAVVYSLD